MFTEKHKKYARAPLEEMIKDEDVKGKTKEKLQQFINLINKISKNSHESGEELIAETNKLIASKLPDISNNFFENLESARKLLLSRRIERI
jgi:Zn-dependent oligopeptidase